MTLDSVKSYRGAPFKKNDQTDALGGRSSSSFQRLHSYLFVWSEVFIRIACDQPGQSCKEDGSGPFYDCAHLCSIMYECGFVFCKSAQLLSSRRRMMLHLHDVDSVKGYERKLAKKYGCRAQQRHPEPVFQQTPMPLTHRLIQQEHRHRKKVVSPLRGKWF